MKNTLLSVLRHVLTAVGAAVVAKNAAKHPELGMVNVETIVGGIIGAVGMIWGPRDEYKAERMNRRD